jgi:GT2 family glycosyltransferase
MDVSVIIANYNTKTFLRNCLESIYVQTKNINFEIIVSDNGSSDGSFEMIKNEFPQVIIIKNLTNLGFGAANNRGLDAAIGKYVFFLNSDTIFLNNVLKHFYDFYENYPNSDKLGVLGCNLYDENMRVSRSCWPFPSVIQEIKYRVKLNIRLLFFTICYLFKYNPHFKEKSAEIKEIIGEVDGFICGADLFMKNDKSTRFDENFFLYYEETDLEYRLKERGKKIMLINGPKIIHYSGGSDFGKTMFEKYFSLSKIHFHISTIIYFRNRNITRGIWFIKFLIVLYLCNPFQIKKTAKYINQIIRL